MTLSRQSAPSRGPRGFASLGCCSRSRKVRRSREEGGDFLGTRGRCKSSLRKALTRRRRDKRRTTETMYPDSFTLFETVAT